MRPLLKTWGLNAVLMLVSLTVFGLTVELGVRGLQKLKVLSVLNANSVSPPTFQGNKAKLIPSGNAILCFENDPKAPGINSIGMRDQEYRLESPANIRRITVMGDSVTFGLGVPLEQTYAKQLQNRLNGASRGGLGFQVMNFGVNGYSTESELELFKLKARKFKPAVVVVGYVMNDPIPTSMLFAAVASVLKDTRDFARLAETSQVLAWVKMEWDKATTATKALRMYEPLYDPGGKQWNAVVNSFREFKRYSEEDHFRLVVLVFPMLYDFEHYPFANYHQQVLNTLGQMGITYIDLLPEYRRFDARDLRFKDTDATHPNELGHRIAAEKLQVLLQDLE